MSFVFIILATKHRSEKGTKSLTCHAPGNWKGADFGGVAGKVCKTSAVFLKLLFNILSDEAEKQGFSHVHKDWYARTESIETGLQRLSELEANILDIKVPLNQWQPVVTDEDKFAMRNLTTGRDFYPTENCLGNFAMAGKGRFGVLKDLNEDKKHATKEDTVVFARDRRDAEIMRDYVNLLLFQPDRVDQKKVRLFRTYENDNTMRAMLSKDYTVVNNSWVLETVSKFVPGGRLSHWKGDVDTMFGNILIPDTIREDKDSDYGGMVSVGNSEIGTRRLTSLPSVFRAICMNGCIWDQELGKGVDITHRRKDGKLDLTKLAENIKANLEAQIPLIDSGIRLVLAKKELGFDNVPPLNVVAAVIQKYRIGKKLAKGIVQAYGVEEPIVGNSAFTVMQALTRYGQTRNALVWYNLDVTAGYIAKLDKNAWSKIVRAAAALEDKDLEKIGVS